MNVDREISRVSASVTSLNHGEPVYSDSIEPAKLAEWQTTQAKLSAQLRFEPIDVPNLRTIAGVDISFSPTSNLAIASLVVFSYPLEQKPTPIYIDFYKAPMTEPYCPGYLAFRELPLLSVLFEKLQRLNPEIYPPGVTLVDGNGIWHPRGLGSASHIGAVFDIPTIGVAKTFFHLPEVGIGNETLKSLSNAEEREVTGTDNKVYGAAVRTGGSTRHVFVSCGHRCDLPSAVALVKSCSFFRIPEPIRQADLQSRKVIREQSI
jgi:endonuclease V